jgi:hypothetical protein
VRRDRDHRVRRRRRQAPRGAEHDAGRLALRRLLAEARDAGATACVMEVSSHALDRAAPRACPSGGRPHEPRERPPRLPKTPRPTSRPSRACSPASRAPPRRSSTATTSRGPSSPRRPLPRRDVRHGGRVRRARVGHRSSPPTAPPSACASRAERGGRPHAARRPPT